jgi:hypothetical protein
MMTHKSNGYFQPTKHPAEPKPRLDSDAQAGLVPPLWAIGFMNFNQLRRQLHPDRPKARGPACKQNIRAASAHD